VLVSVVLTRVFAMFRGVQCVTMRNVRVVGGCFVISCFVMLCRFSMVFGGVFVVLRRLVMVLSAFVSHDDLLSSKTSRQLIMEIVCHNFIKTCRVNCRFRFRPPQPQVTLTQPAKPCYRRADCSML
jgi:hypothetical protein